MRGDASTTTAGHICVALTNVTLGIQTFIYFLLQIIFDTTPLLISCWFTVDARSIIIIRRTFKFARLGF